MAQINLRVDDNLKSSAERTLNDIGLSMSTAITLKEHELVEVE